jgi:hypothetical protein
VVSFCPCWFVGAFTPWVLLFTCDPSANAEIIQHKPKRPHTNKPDLSNELALAQRTVCSSTSVQHLRYFLVTLLQFSQLTLPKAMAYVKANIPPPMLSPTHETIGEESQCVICQERQVSVGLSPCNHYVLCAHCDLSALTIYVKNRIDNRLLMLPALGSQNFTSEMIQSILFGMDSGYSCPMCRCCVGSRFKKN